MFIVEFFKKMRYEKEVFVINNFTLSLKKKMGIEGRIKINKINTF